MNRLNKNYFIILIFLFLGTRILMALFLAPHNDEIIYTQYAQLINQNWENNKYVSVNGSFLSDYKEPLQYWLTSISVDWWVNPLWGIRLWSIIISLGGFVTWFYLAKKLLGDRVAKIFGILFVFSGYYLYFDAIALAEVYVYSLGGIFLYLSYLWLTKRRWYYPVMASTIFSLALLAKTSAWLILILGIFLPYLLRITQEKIFLKQRWHLFLFYVFLLSNVFVAKEIYWLLVPNKFETIRLNSPAFKAVMSWQELASMPLNIWLSNLHFYLVQVLSSDYLFFLWLIFLFLGLYFSWRGQLEISGKDRRLFFSLGLWWLISLMPIIFLVETNYLRHYGMWLMIFYLWLALAIKIGVDFFEKRTQSKFFAMVVVVLASVLILNQIYASFYPLFKFNQTDTGELEVTDLWASPLGIKDLVDYLKTLPPATVFYDAQWGHFSTDLLVFSHYYPQLKFVPLEDEFGRRQPMIPYERKGQKIFIIFDTYWLGHEIIGPSLRQIAFNQKLCSKKREIAKKYRQIVAPNKIVVCEVN